MLNNFKNEILDRVKFNGGIKNNHCHLDRALSINNENFRLSQKNLKDKWSLVRDYKTQATIGGLLYRMSKVVEDQIEQGVTELTTFLDFDQYSLDKPFKAFSKLKDIYGKDITLYSANQTLEGVLEEESYKWFLVGSELTDFVGGLPNRDTNKEDEHLEVIFNRAKELDKRLHIHVDQFSKVNEKETELVLDKIEKFNYKSKVSIIHALSVNCKSREYREKIYEKLMLSDVEVVCCPRAWMDREANDEEITRVHNPIFPAKEYYDYVKKLNNNYKIKISIGTDNIADIVIPFSDGDMYKELECFTILNRWYNIDNLVKVMSKGG